MRRPENASASRPDRKLHGILLRIGAISCFSLMAALVKLASDRGVMPLEILFYRNALALPVVLGVVLFGPGIASVATTRPMAHLSRSVIGMVSMFLTFQALAMLPLAEATTIGFTAPLFATLLSAVLLGERVHRHRGAAIAVGFAGVLIVMQPGGHHVPAAGAAVALLAAFAVGIVTITVRQIGMTEPATTTVFWFTVGGTVATSLLLPFVAQAHDGATWGILLGMGLLGGAAQILMTASLRNAPIALLAPFDYLQLAWSILLGWLLWSTAPGRATFVGAALIVASGLYTVYRERRLHVTANAAAATHPGP